MENNRTINIGTIGNEQEAREKAALLPHSSAVREEAAKYMQPPTNRKERREQARKNKKINNFLDKTEREEARRLHAAANKKFSTRLRARINANTQHEFAKKHNKAWDEVSQCSSMVYTMLSMSVSLSPILKRTELTNHYPDANYTGRVTQALVAELIDLLRAFNGIRAKHSGKIGRAASIEEQLLSYEVYNSYMILAEKYNSSAAHLFDIVSEQIHAAIATYRHHVGDEEGKKLADELRAQATAAITAVHTARKKVEEPEEIQTQQPEAEEVAA